MHRVARRRREWRKREFFVAQKTPDATDYFIRRIKNCFILDRPPKSKAGSVSTRPAVEIMKRIGRVASQMRRRFAKFLPIVLIALAVQILAPIGACWEAGVAGLESARPGRIWQ